MVGGIFAGYGYRTMPQMIVDEEARFSVGTDDAMSAEPLVADETNFSLPKMIFEVASSGCSCRKPSFKRRAENGGFVPIADIHVARFPARKCEGQEAKNLMTHATKSNHRVSTGCHKNRVRT